MGFTSWARRTAAAIRQDGWVGVNDGLYGLYAGAWRTLGWHVPRGTNVYERDWDLLVVLDACRTDLLREVAPNYEFIGDVESIESVGSMSEEWLVKTFMPEYADELRDTVHVTANVFSEEVLDADNFRDLDEVWRYAWDDDSGIVPPRPVTDRAIHHGRTRDPDRLIVHYMQPHHPFIADGVPEFESDPFGREGNATVVDALRRGDIGYEEFWAAYRANLELVLADVRLLLSNYDAERAVLTADHGDALGEWGIYDHPAGFLHPIVRNVPWAETEGVDEGTYEPSTERGRSGGEDVEQRLRDLGYV